MRLLVSFKITPDLDQIRGGRWTISNNRPVEPAFARQIINPYDESALELALKSADTAGESGLITELTALTIGGKEADLFLKKLLASGYNLVHRINRPCDLNFNPQSVASILAAFVRVFGYPDAIIMGMQSSEEDNAKTPLLTAEMLHWPCITAVTGFAACGPGMLRVNSLSDQGEVEQIVRTPCLLAVGNAPGSHLRVPTLKAIKAVGAVVINQIEPECLPVETFPLDPVSDTELIELVTVDNRRRGLVIEGASAEEKAILFYNRYLKGWLGEL